MAGSAEEGKRPRKGPVGEKRKVWIEAGRRIPEASWVKRSRRDEARRAGDRPGPRDGTERGGTCDNMKVAHERKRSRR